MDLWGWRYESYRIVFALRCILFNCDVLSAVANGVPLIWYLSGVEFTDGGTASGSFTYDADSNTYSNINITTVFCFTYAT